MTDRYHRLGGDILPDPHKCPKCGSEMSVIVPWQQKSRNLSDGDSFCPICGHESKLEGEKSCENCTYHHEGISPTWCDLYLNQHKVCREFEPHSEAEKLEGSCPSCDRPLFGGDDCVCGWTREGEDGH